MPAHDVSFDEIRKEWTAVLNWKMGIDTVLYVVLPITIACLSRSDTNNTAISIISIMLCVCAVPKIAYEVYMYLFEKAGSSKDKTSLHDLIGELRSEITELRQGQSNLVLRIDRRESDWEQGHSNLVREIQQNNSNILHGMSNMIFGWSLGLARSYHNPGAGNGSPP